MKSNSEPPTTLIFFCSIIVCFVVLNFYYSNKKERKVNCVKSICSVYKFGKGGGRGKMLIYACYYFNSIRYEGTKAVEYPNDFINKYYEIEFSSKKPDNFEIFLDKEVTDVNEIKNAGFEKEDINR